MNNKIFINDNFKLTTKVIDGEIYFDAADVAKSLGFITVAKSGNVCVRWNRLNQYLENYPDVVKVKAGDFIPEAAAYLLTMKANNEIAVKFQLWLSTEVLPSIRKYGAYITNDASKENVDKLELYGKYRIKKTFSNATKSNIQRLIDGFEEFIFGLSAKDTITSLKSAIKGLEEFKEKNIDNVAYCYLVEEKLKDYTKLMMFKQNKINGGIKSHKTKVISKLESKVVNLTEIVENLYPSEDEFITIPIHPFSVNNMYSLGLRKERVRSKAYNNWIKNFPKVNWPNLNSNKYYEVFLQYEHLEKFDTDNFSKSIIDQITRETGVDDSNFISINVCSTQFVDSYEDGKIHVCIKEINS
ncbi:BRO-N domain-containing protein [Clostridium perfringens]|nr:BRO family protein [Clostridium perfringens]